MTKVDAKLSMFDLFIEVLFVLLPFSLIFSMQFSILSFWIRISQVECVEIKFLAETLFCLTLCNSLNVLQTGNKAKNLFQLFFLLRICFLLIFTACIYHFLLPKQKKKDCIGICSGEFCFIFLFVTFFFCVVCYKTTTNV